MYPECFSRNPNGMETKADPAHNDVARNFSKEVPGHLSTRFTIEI